MNHITLRFNNQADSDEVMAYYEASKELAHQMEKYLCNILALRVQIKTSIKC